MKRRVFLVVLDSFGIGYEPDAADFGDVGSNTLATIMKSEYYNTPNMKKLGLFNIDGVEAESKEENVVGAYGRMQERSRGKDTTVGHWEIAGLVSEQPLPTYPNGFPQDVLDEFTKNPACVLNYNAIIVDEAQFASPEQIDLFSDIVDTWQIPPP